MMAESRGGHTEDQEVAHAIGYLRGVSVVPWNLDGEKGNIDFSIEDAARFDRQVAVLAHAVLGKEGE